MLKTQYERFISTTKIYNNQVLAMLTDSSFVRRT